MRGAGGPSQRPAEVVELIGDKRCFVLHAPRQTGKTNGLLAQMKLINEGGRYRALYVNIESAQALRSGVDRGLAIVREDVEDAGVVYLGDDAPRRTTARATAVCPSCWTLERYRAARERLIQGRDTHLHQLGDKLREARVSSSFASTARPGRRASPAGRPGRSC